MPLPKVTTGRVAAVGLLLVLATAVISGVSTFVNSYALVGTSSDAFVTVRNLVVALMIAPVALVATRRAPERLRAVDYGWLALVGLIGGAIPFLLFFHGLQLATAAGGAATASFVYRTLFLMATVFGIVLLHERFSARVFAGAALLLAGNVLLLSIISPLWTPGTTYVLAATVLWAAEYTVSKHLLGSLRSSTVGFGRMGFGAAFLLAYLALTSQYGAVAAMSGAQWTWVAISALLLTAFVLTWYAGLQRVDLSVATSMLVLGFPVTFLLGILAKGAHFTLDEAIGAAAVVAGAVVIAGWRQWRDLGSYLRASVARRAPTSA
ncbi:MAG: DMT family transporter [Thermoplasmata archaeon]|jgi:drug/metabolite transporter (DMT)-like permease